jgi:hypothetical protein
MKNEAIEKILADVKDSQAKLEEIRVILRNKVLEVFPLATKELFNQFPELKSFGWKQYTPYFNDGDECIFSVRIDSLTINGFDYYDGDDADRDDMINIHRRAKRTIWNGGIVDNPEFSEYFENIVNTIKEVVKAFGDEDLKFIFGEHSEVLVTADGAESKEYYHD